MQSLTNLSHIQAQICHVFVHCRCRFLGAVYPNLSKTVVVSASPGAIDKIKDIEDQVKEVEASLSHPHLCRLMLIKFFLIRLTFQA